MSRSPRTSPLQPVGRLRREQAGAGDAGAARRRARRARRHRGARRSITSARDSPPRSSPRASRGRSRSSKRDASSRRCASAISTHGATSPTCATWCAPTARWSARGTRGLAYNVCRGEALSDAGVDRRARRTGPRARESRRGSERAAGRWTSRSSLARTTRLTSDTGWQPESLRPHARRPARLLARAGPFLVRPRPRSRLVALTYRP